MNDYVRNVKLYKMVKEKLVTFCCVTKLLDLQQQVFILTLMSLWLMVIFGWSRLGSCDDSAVGCSFDPGLFHLCSGAQAEGIAAMWGMLFS